MAAILIVEEDGVLARQMARTLRATGHFPIHASDAHSALREANDRPDVILLDLELSDLPGEELLTRLQSQSDMVSTPVLAITWNKEAGARLREKGGVANVLSKPVSGVHLRQAVHDILATQEQSSADALHLDRERQRNLVRRLVVEGSDPLVLHIARRVCADRTGARSSNHAETLTWAEIADWGRREGLLDAEQARLARRVPLSAAPRVRECAA